MQLAQLTIKIGTGSKVEYINPQNVQNVLPNSPTTECSVNMVGGVTLIALHTAEDARDIINAAMVAV